MQPQKRVTVRTISTDPVYNPGRSFKHYGYLDNNNDFWYDGNWEAEDNGLFNYYPDSDEPEDFVIPFGSYEILS